MLDFDIRFEPETPEEKLEAAKLEVVDLLDHKDWKWLGTHINDEALCWNEIFEIVAEARYAALITRKMLAMIFSIYL